ncbi:hypothetical protein Hanom_Chr12g01074141 [Helianthus anomalus]
MVQPHNNAGCLCFKIQLFFKELIARMVPVVSRFFTFSPHLLEIAGMLPKVCHFVTRTSNNMTNHMEHTCYFQN